IFTKELLMSRYSYKETIQKQMQHLSNQLFSLQSSEHILKGHKKWNVFDRKKEALEKELKDSLEEYQRILHFTYPQ
ncbi:MAG: hypothetical protein EBZ47_06625, partial [Chlamydiae bacterium]|nr:hypothetical protein [Chlamydiota bacterium]